MSLITSNFIRVCIGLALLLIQITCTASPNLDGIQVYQKNIHLSDEHKQQLAKDLNVYHNADNLWDVLREEFILPHYEELPQVQEQISWYLNHPDFLINSTNRAAPYLYFIHQQVKKNHLPAELVLLPMIESAYNPFACSSAGAIGMWQMMPCIASGFGVKRDWWYDGRRDVVASTHAALNFLSYLGSLFENNWLLAIAAYDTGEGNILSAIHRNIREGKSADYWSLPLARETREYIPRLLALASIIAHPETYRILLPVIPNAPYLAQVDIGKPIGLKLAATLAGMSYQTLKLLNPAYNQHSSKQNGPSKLLLPIESVVEFSENLSKLTGYKKDAEAAKNFQIVKSQPITTTPNMAESPKEIVPIYTAQTNAPPLADLTQTYAANSTIKTIPEDTIIKTNENTTNNINPPMMTSNAENLKSTQTNSLVKPVPVDKSEVLPIEVNHLDLRTAILSAMVDGRYQLQPGDTYYVVRKNDNIEKIATRFKMETSTIALVNPTIDIYKLTPGSSIIIPTHLAELIKEYQYASNEKMYEVKRGDTVESIAKKLNKSAAAIRINNLLTQDAVLIAGDRLIIPV